MRKTYSAPILPLMIALVVVLFCLGAPQADAKTTVIRGPVIAVDHEAKTITIETSKGIPVELKYDDATRFKQGVRSAEEVQVGMVFRATQGEGKPAVHTFRMTGQSDAASAQSSGASDESQTATSGKDLSQLEAETVIYPEGGSNYHMENCSRVGDTTGWKKSTLAEAEREGLRIKCGKCARVWGRKYGINMFKREPVEVKYSPDTKVYCNALWMTVHAEGCPNQLMQERRKTMTLAEADKAGWKIADCCLPGYRRQHPVKELDDETIIAGPMQKNRWNHVPGCHRYWGGSTHTLAPAKVFKEAGFGICPHCRKRGPSVASITQEAWKAMGPDGVQELPFTDPLASAEQFMGMRFFFPVGSWLSNYQQYRATGDQNALDTLFLSARHYNSFAQEFAPYAERKASNPEGAAFMLSMAMCSRITLQNALANPGSVSREAIAEAEAFLNTMLSVLEPTWVGGDDLDPEMGVPKDLASDFRRRQGNRAINGIATVGMMTSALMDLQKLKGTTAYQSKIDHYRNVAIASWLKFFKESGYICKDNGGFYYPYKPEGNGRKVIDGCKVFKRPEDNSHFRFTITGSVFLYESGLVDDAFMNALAVSVRDGMEKRQGAFTCPCVPPAKVKEFRGESEEYIPLNAFIAGISKGRGRDTERWTGFANYVSALRKDRSVVHLSQ